MELLYWSKLYFLEEREIAIKSNNVCFLIWVAILFCIYYRKRRNKGDTLQKIYWDIKEKLKIIIISLIEGQTQAQDSESRYHFIQLNKWILNVNMAQNEKWHYSFKESFHLRQFIKIRVYWSFSQDGGVGGLCSPSMTTSKLQLNDLTIILVNYLKTSWTQVS